jgi:hypothetical protein
MPMLRSSTTISWEKIGSRSIQEIADHNGSCVRGATQQHEASRSVTAARRGLSKRKKKRVANDPFFSIAAFILVGE